MRSYFWILLSFMLPLHGSAQDGHFSFSMQLTPDDAKTVGNTLWDGLSKGRYLGYEGIDGTYSLTYGDVVDEFDGKMMKDAEVTEVVISVYWSGASDYLEPFMISPQYVSNRNEIFYSLLDVQESFDAEDIDRIQSQIGEEMLRHINARQEATDLVNKEMVTVQKINFKNENDLFLAPLGRIPGQLMEGLESGKYLAYSGGDLGEAMTFEEGKKNFNHYQSVYPDLLEGLFLYESWNKEAFQWGQGKPTPKGPIRYDRKLEAIGFGNKEGDRIFFKWNDVRAFLGELGVWLQEEPKPEKLSEGEEERLVQIGQAAIYRLYFRSHFAQKLAVKLAGEPEYLKDRW